MDYTICDAAAAHLPQLAALERACFSAPWTRAQLAGQLPDDRHVFLIAAAGETVLGYANFLHVLDEGDIGNVAVAPEHRRFNGYVYDGPNWSAFSPQEKGFEFLDVLQELQDAMAAETGNRWKQALIHITRPGPEIDIQFEYDDPTRWSLKKVSLDLADYAESLRPPGANK